MAACATHTRPPPLSSLSTFGTQAVGWRARLGDGKVPPGDDLRGGDGGAQARRHELDRVWHHALGSGFGRGGGLVGRGGEVGHLGGASWLHSRVLAIAVVWSCVLECTLVVGGGRVSVLPRGKKVLLR